MLPHTLLVLMASSLVTSLENGLARTPPMGWLTWQRFRCITDCKLYPKDCISENLITRMADLMAEKGYKDAGYEYLGIDDCWMEKNRDEQGNLVAHKQRFPKGMKYISDYIHSKGLKFGIYEDYGTNTCQGLPGSLGHEKEDIALFLSWDFDYIKLDGCYIDLIEMNSGYPYFGELLNNTGRPILYSCSWPAYQEGSMMPDYDSISKSCNLWRNYGDIDDSYTSVRNIMNWFATNQDRLAKYAKPGAWNDPDMLVIGNYGLTVDQSQVQMAVWAILAAPLLISADLETIRPEFEEILLNKKVIAVNQDPLGKQGLRIHTEKKYEIWSRDLQDGSKALAFVSKRTDGGPLYKTFTYDDMKLEKGMKYAAENLFDNEPDMDVTSSAPFSIKINPTGVKFFKFKPKAKESGETSSEELETSENKIDTDKENETANENETVKEDSVKENDSKEIQNNEIDASHDNKALNDFKRIKSMRRSRYIY